jgi:hypothetical protein
MAGVCEDGNEFSGSLKTGNFLIGSGGINLDDDFVQIV